MSLEMKSLFIQKNNKKTPFAEGALTNIYIKNITHIGGNENEKKTT